MTEPADRLAMFIPLAKADAARRLVYGYFDETPDRAGEVCDYVSARPAFEIWSAELEKASEGKSLGNIRGQHSNVAAGKLVELNFDDAARRIGFVARIVDDNEWRKVEEGVYTGFSPGGRYARRWKEGAHVRYTPLVRELSIVDLPCNPAATFTMVKADGAEREVRFAIGRAYEPGNEKTLARAEALAKAAGGGKRASNFVTVARAELIAENAAEALAKLASTPTGPGEADAAPGDASAQGDASAAGLKDCDIIQSMHDQAVKLGARCGAGAQCEGESGDPKPGDGAVGATDMTKMLPTDEPRVERLAAAFETLAGAHQEAQDKLAKAEARIADLMRRPEMAKGRLIAIDKESDGGGEALRKQGDPLEAIRAMPAGPAKTRAILEAAARR
jgi:hypothetical protein